MSETDTEVDLSEWSTIDVAGNSDDSSSSKVEFEIEEKEEVASKEEPQRQVRVKEESQTKSSMSYGCPSYIFHADRRIAHCHCALQ